MTNEKVEKVKGKIIANRRMTTVLGKLMKKLVFHMDHAKLFSLMFWA